MMENLKFTSASLLTKGMSGSAGSQPILLTSSENFADDLGLALGPCVYFSGPRCLLGLNCMMVPLCAGGQLLREESTSERPKTRWSLQEAPTGIGA